MTNFLIIRGGKVEHYFYKPYEGICMRKQSPGGTWQEHCSVLADGGDVFCVYADPKGNVHLICIDEENRLVYATQKSDIWKKYILTPLSSDIFVSDIRIYSINGRLNFLYSALYSGETLLVHCILGDHARPSTIATLETSHFYIQNHRVYFTNSSGTLGYASLSDEAPSIFHPLCEDAHFCTLSEICGKEIMIFTRNSRLYVNGGEMLYDSRMEMPVFVRGYDRSYIMWKSGSFVRYIATFNGGVTWSEPMRFMNTGITPTLYIAQTGDSYDMYYGCPGKSDITIFGVPDIFKMQNHFSSELEDLKKQLSKSKAETMNAKREIERLNRIISGMM